MTALPMACRVSPRADYVEPPNPVWFEAGAWRVTETGMRSPSQTIPADALGLRDRAGMLLWPQRIARSEGHSRDFLRAFRVACALHHVNVTAEMLDASEVAAQHAQPIVPPVVKLTAKPKVKPPAVWVLMPDGSMTNGTATLPADRLSSPDVLPEVVAAEPMGLESFLALWPAMAEYPAEVRAARKSVRVWHYEAFGRKLPQ